MLLVATLILFTGKAPGTPPSKPVDQQHGFDSEGHTSKPVDRSLKLPSLRSEQQRGYVRAPDLTRSNVRYEQKGFFVRKALAPSKVRSPNVASLLLFLSFQFTFGRRCLREQNVAAICLISRDCFASQRLRDENNSIR